MSSKEAVVVIGSGAGGGAFAWALARRGVRALVLERGPAFDPANDYRLHEDAWETTRFPATPGSVGRHTFAPLQALAPAHAGLRSWNRHSGRLIPGTRRVAWGYRHVLGVGGSTLHFTGEAHRLHPAAMNMRSRFGVAADWPLSYAELEPWYGEAERAIGVAGPAGTPVRTRSQPYPLPAHPASFASRTLGAGCRRLGLGWEPNALAALSQPYDGRPACNYCGGCNRGCPRGDKGSVDVTFVRRARARGVCEIRTGCQVTRLEAGPGDRVRAVHYVDRDGNAHAVTADVVVVACGAVETPRLLLSCESGYAPAGLGNESGLVGRNFMETLYWTASGLHPEPLGSHRGLPCDHICWDYNAPDAIPGIIGGCRFSPGMAEADLIGPVNHARRAVAGWGRSHKAAMRETFGHTLTLTSIGENLPNPGSYVDLDPAATDAAGLPLARIHSHLDEREIARLGFMAGKSREILAAAGVPALFEEYGAYDAFNATHVFGTCRMGNDPAQSVVDRDCRSHRWRNLLVVDASVFPSSGGGEGPSLTIEAVALRAAARLVDDGV